MLARLPMKTHPNCLFHPIPGFSLFPALVLAAFLLMGFTRAHGGQVRVEICEQGLQDKDEWPAKAPAASEEFSIPAFGLDELPAKYVDDGVRGERPSPSLVRMSARVEIPAGRHRVLVRARSAARLVVGGKPVVETPFPPKNGGDGSQHDTERKEPLDLGEGFRFAPAGEYERIAEVTAEGGMVDVILEAFVGGREGKSPRRVELGETVVAIALEGSGKWQLLSPNRDALPYTDEAWEHYREGLAGGIAQRNAAARRALRDKQAAFWKMRRDAAQRWLAGSAEVAVPALPEGFPANNPVDHFIAAKFDAVKAQSRHAAADAVDYFRDVKPLLDARCVDCHRGAKAKGGLQLDSLAAALVGGDSGPAFERGNAAKSELLRRVASHDADEVMPPKGARLTEGEVEILKRWVNEGASWPELPLVRGEFTPPAEDHAFLRRLFLDTVGVVPTIEEARDFLDDRSPGKREKWIDRLLADPRWADHWMPMWQDLLAENPNILNPTLNNTGPFRRWLYEALQDDLPLDRMVTQLVLQRGSGHDGAPAGFGLASQNDAPFAAKGTIVSAGMLGVEMKCARCHDSPNGAARQEQLFQLGALLASKPIEVPVTSSVDPVKLHAGGRKALIEVTLKPGTKVAPVWPFAGFAEAALADTLASNPGDSRERLAALLTAPQNERFAQVMVNRIWQRFMGRGIVEPLDDWEKGRPTHPELLRWLARELVRGGYDTKVVARWILRSAAYQRATDPGLKAPDALYSAPEPRRLLAEQVVDSAFSACGLPLRVEPLCLDLNGRRDTANSIDLGRVSRAWMLASLSNERDRPSLMLPRLQAVADVMAAFGWRGARQDPASVRDSAPNALQPAILANGVMSNWLVRMSDAHGVTGMAVAAASPEELVEALFLRLLTRSPLPKERERFAGYLREGFASRVLPNPTPLSRKHVAPKLVTWTNHLLPEANTAKQELEAEARKGEPASPRLARDWRSRCEDVLWALLNSPEMIYRP